MQTKDLRNTIEPIFDFIHWGQLATLDPINSNWGWFENRLGVLGRPVEGFTPEDCHQLADALRELAARIVAAAIAVDDAAETE